MQLLEAIQWLLSISQRVMLKIILYYWEVVSMLKTEKKVIKLEVIQRLAELFPNMTVVALLEYFEYCEMIKAEMGLDTIGVTDGGDC